jgi:hypothetical protein
MYPARLALLLALLALVAAVFAADSKDDNDSLLRAVTLYASFDKEVKADVGGGTLTLSTRYNHLKEKGKFVVEKGFPAKAFRIAEDKGISGGALEAVDVLPNNGRIFFPARGNIAFKKGGWSGGLSVWVKTDPNKLLKTKFCDPIQITQKGANDGGIWFDFNDAKPRDMRMGVFPAIPPGGKGISESDPKAPMVWMRKVGFTADRWHHVALTWRNLDTGKKTAEATLFIDGKRIGAVKDRALAMAWDVDRAGIYIAVNYIGLLDELALFNRELTGEDVKELHAKPGLLAGLKKGRK